MMQKDKSKAQTWVRPRGAVPAVRIGALDQPLSSREEAALPTPDNIVPDGCNLGVVLRVLVVSNMAAFLATLLINSIGSDQKLFVSEQFWAAWTLFEAVVILTLVNWCVLRRFLSPLPAKTQRAVVWSVPAVLTGVLGTVFQIGVLGHTIWIFMLVALLSAAAIQHYLELRARAYSPAIAEARFQALQSRIRPHFFFNSLNAVLAVLRDDPKRAERMLENIAELYRAVMADVRKLVPLVQELDLCHKYIEIEQTRLGERLKVHWDIGATHPRCRVPQLLLQPIIENAVRYGAEKIAGQCEIIVRVRQLGFTLEVKVSNPIAQEPIQREGNQIGLANIRGRLALIYDLEATLEARVSRNRFELRLTLPVERKQSVQ